MIGLEQKNDVTCFEYGNPVAGRGVGYAGIIGKAVEIEQLPAAPGTGWSSRSAGDL